ncbi:hypothetical protein MNBD_GAMMA10-1736 [hydrothermal vent metagenome]|uniref:Uncharacterized protein n=1 Tax=hydrothermal vent metagenome TaxID=652676 RepID=A0A3B0XTJ6_9ZZZZ
MVFEKKHLGLLIIIALVAIFSEWQVTAAFFIASTVMPFLFIFLSDIFRALFKKKYKFKFREACKQGWKPGSSFGIVAFIFLLPLYYAVSAFEYSIVFSFPIATTIIMLSSVKIAVKKSFGFIIFIISILFSISHSLLILWLISFFNSLV